MTTACMIPTRSLRPVVVNRQQQLRALLVAALDAWLQDARPERRQVVAAAAAVRTAIRRDASSLVARYGVEPERATAWLGQLVREVAALRAPGPSALCWWAVEAFDEARVAPWTRFSEAVRRLAEALEPEGAAYVAPRFATELRTRMEAAW
jgi:hypothetical protein